MLLYPDPYLLQDEQLLLHPDLQDHEYFSGTTSDWTDFSFCWSGTASAAKYSYIVPNFSEAVPLDPSGSTSASTYSSVCLSGTPAS